MSEGKGSIRAGALPKLRLASDATALGKAMQEAMMLEESRSASPDRVSNMTRSEAQTSEGYERMHQLLLQSMKELAAYPGFNEWTMDVLFNIVLVGDGLIQKFATTQHCSGILK
eukprot:2149782-Amphidinium_carterae.1